MQIPGLKQLAMRPYNGGFRLALAAGAAAFMLLLGSDPAICCLGEIYGTISTEAVYRPALAIGFTMAQDDDDSGDGDIPPSDLEKYVAIYRDMQNDRGLTVEQAAAKEGLSLAAFRDLEQKVERDDAAREHVRDELQESAAQASGDNSAAQSKSAK